MKKIKEIEIAKYWRCVAVLGSSRIWSHDKVKMLFFNAMFAPPNFDELKEVQKEVTDKWKQIWEKD